MRRVLSPGRWDPAPGRAHARAGGAPLGRRLAGRERYASALRGPRHRVHSVVGRADGEAGGPPVDRDGPAPSPIPHVVSTTQGLRVGRPLPAQRRPRTRSHSRHHRHPLPLHDPLNSKHGQRWLGRRDPFDSGAPASLSCGLIEQLFPRHDQRSLSGIASLLVGYAVPAGRLGRVALLTSSRSYRPPVRVALYGGEFGWRPLWNVIAL